MKVRNKYIDLLKGVLMTLVVIGHLYFLDYNSRTLTLIYSFHMPAFLLIGGYLSNYSSEDNILLKIKKRFIKIIIPYFIFNIIAIILFSTDLTRYNNVENMLLGVGDPKRALNLPTWFLTFYFLIMTFFDFIKYITNKISLLIVKYKYKNKKPNEISEKLELILTVIFIIIGYFMWKYLRKLWLPYNIQQSFFCIGFVYIGSKISKISQIFNHCKSILKTKINKYMTDFSINILLLLIIIMIGAIWYILAIKNGRIDINAKCYNNKFIFYITALLGATLISIISYLLYKIPLIQNLFSYLGRNSIYILGYHVLTVGFIRSTIIPCFSIKAQNYLSSFNIYSLIFYVSIEIIFSLLIGFIHKNIIKRNGI